jgi:uncharacterized tellurite resistance protein B-like protein
MPFKDFGKGLKDSLQGAVDTVKTKAKDVELPDLKTVTDKASVQVKDLFQKKDTTAKGDEAEAAEAIHLVGISTRNAIKVIYFLMAADGEIYHNEEEKFDAIGKELDPDFDAAKAQIIAECQKSLDKVIDPEDYYDALQDGVEDALLTSKRTADTFITPKLLLWDLLTVAYSDEEYNEVERKLLKYIVRKLDIDKGEFLEMESSMQTLLALEKELVWIKTTDKPYLTIEAMVNEIADRKNVIFDSVKDLITL